MDKRELSIAAELTKINFVLEALWANVLFNHDATPDDVDRLAADLRRQFLTLPGRRSAGGQAPANDDELSELSAARMETFFAGVRARIESALPRPRQ